MSNYKVDASLQVKNLVKVEESITKIVIKPMISFERHVWITATRREIPVKEMSTNHIKNCINCWMGNGNLHIPHDYLGGRDKWLKILNDELNSRN